MVITAEMARDALAGRDGRGPVVFIDLALPRDVDPAVDRPARSRGDRPGGHRRREPGGRRGGRRPGRRLGPVHDEDIAAVRRIVAEEVAAHASAVHAARVTPTVVALRAKAAKVVDAELTRLAGRLAGTASHELDEIAQAMRRVVDKLLHAPTVRVKELAGSPGGDSYAAALRELFDLDPKAVEAVTRADADLGGEAEWGGIVNRGTLRLGTRRSLMARTQAGQVAQMITARTGLSVDLVGVTTFGDVSKADLASIGGTGVFVSALRERLLAGEVDLAVHSLKDLPTAQPDGVVIAAVPPRDDPRDALAARGGAKLADLPQGARVGTGSTRRVGQLRALRRDLDCVPIRGNADSRLARVASGDLDAVVLAYAGLIRIGRQDAVTQIFEPDEMLPAPGQGALAVECRADDAALISELAAVDDPATRAAVTAERSVLADLGGRLQRASRRIRCGNRCAAP